MRLLRSKTFLTVTVFVALVLVGVYRVGQAQMTPLDTLQLPQDGSSIVQKAFEAVKRVLRAIGDWLAGIGVDIGRLIRLFGEFIVLLFESLAKLARWVFGWIGGAVGR